MNKSELIAKIADSADISKAMATAALEGFLSAVTDSLKDGKDVALVGFGTFTVKTRAARTGRNPQTGAAIEIKEAQVAGFKPGKSLKESINE